MNTLEQAMINNPLTVSDKRLEGQSAFGAIRVHIEGIGDAVAKTHNHCFERAAYLVSLAGGWTNVPTTVLRDIDMPDMLYRGTHSVQYFVNGHILRANLEPNEVWNWERIVDKWSNKISLDVFDYIIGNDDRHTSNIIVTGKTDDAFWWWIDNGNSFNAHERKSLGQSIRKQDKDRIIQLADNLNNIQDELKPLMSHRWREDAYSDFTNRLQKALNLLVKG